MRIKRQGKYRSTLEARVVLNLEARGVEYLYEKHKVPYTKNYIPDIQLSNGIFVEIKGYFSPEDRSKHLAVKRDNPELDIRFCFGNSKNKLGNGSSTTYAKWCDRHGFKYCDNKIPDEWIGEN